MSMEIFADHPVHEQITRRWSPYSFDGRSVTDEDLRLLHDRCQPGDRWRVHDLVRIRILHRTLRARYPAGPIGYSGHETGLAPSLAAVALGVSFVERHITLDRAMWGTDQAASVERVGFECLIRNIRDIEKSLGDGVKRLYDSELGPRKKLRRVR
jgi:hypothetical protein